MDKDFTVMPPEMAQAFDLLPPSDYWQARDRQNTQAYTELKERHDILMRALQVMVLDSKIHRFLTLNDPKALEQAEYALEGKIPDGMKAVTR